MSSMAVNVPDVGVEGEMEIIEICVSVNDQLDVDSPIVVLETDKATVEVPSPEAGLVQMIHVSVGDKVTMGAPLIQLQSSGDSDDGDLSGTPDRAPAESAQEAAQSASPGSLGEEISQASATTEKVIAVTEETICVPDLGGAESVEVIEVQVAVGDLVGLDDELIVLESDKATMEIPSPYAGELLAMCVQVGDKVSEGAAIATLKVPVASQDSIASKTGAAKSNLTAPQAPMLVEQREAMMSAQMASAPKPNASVHAGPAVRKLARELGADLLSVTPTGPRGRILKGDLKSYVKQQVARAQTGQSVGSIPVKPLPDFSQFGSVEVKPMNKMQRVTAENMQASWLSVPHVTQFDEADITEMEQFRQAQKADGERRGVKLTPVVFLLKACAYALRQMPQFNVSIDMHKSQVVQKNYVHIGIAVDTPSGLVVPVIRDVDRKAMWELAEECQLLAHKAKERKLLPTDMQGGCFTISSLGGIGGTAFTPIVNTPEVAILGLSKAQYKPVFNGEGFDARLMMPLSLSYDHRAINGADAARFTSKLAHVLGDLRQLLL